MKVLFAIQATGNGHLARARELIPELKKQVDLDLLVSGNQGEIELDYPIKYPLSRFGLYFREGWGNRLAKDDFKFAFETIVERYSNPTS